MQHPLDRRPGGRAAAAAEIEYLGYGAIWVGETVRREAFANAALLLSATEGIVVATGTPTSGPRLADQAAGQKSLAEAFPGRFLLGIGASHPPLLAVRGHTDRRPLKTMGAYLDVMDATLYEAPSPEPAATARALAALGRQMLALARERSAGAHPYPVPVEHTASARAVLGPDRLLCAELVVVIEAGPSVVREVTRRHLGAYLRLASYSRPARDSRRSGRRWQRSTRRRRGRLGPAVGSLGPGRRPPGSRGRPRGGAGAERGPGRAATRGAWRDLGPHLTG